MAIKRIEQIDALRGFALFGILMTHMFEGYLASLTPPQYANFTIHYPVDGFFQFVIQNFFIGKFYSIFSLLFGLSFYLILGRKKDASSWRFAWRLVLLFMIGFLHHIHYRGDFLTVYAVFGMVLILFRHVPDNIILVIGLFLAFNGPMVISKAMVFVTPPVVQAVQVEDKHPESAEVLPARKNPVEMAIAYYQLILDGEYRALVRSNATIGLQNKVNFLKFSGRGWVIPGLFLLGLWIGRKGLHEKLDDLPLKRIVIWALLIGLPLMAVNYLSRQHAGNDLLSYLGFAALHASNVFIPLAYIGTVLLLINMEGPGRFMNRLVPVGRMGLSVYVMQSLMGVFIFYGYGFNQLLSMSGTLSLGVGVLIFASLTGFSHWWFRRYKFGPLEWIWRSGTKWQLQQNALSGDSRKALP